MSNEIEKGVLYIVATPIGNMLDITERAIKVLSEVDFIAAEDKRVSGKLLSMLDIKNILISYHEHNKSLMHEPIIKRLISGESGALISDAGTPAISDPGEELVRLCTEKSIKVIPIPGANAAITALSASGMPSKSFVFEGFLADKKSERKKHLELLSAETRTIIFYCAPHDIRQRLSEIYDAFGDRELIIAREMTKINEEIIKTTLKRSVNEPPLERGEFVLIIAGNSNIKEFWCDMTILEHINYYKNSGESDMNAIKLCAKDRKVAKNIIYSVFVKNKS